MAMGVHDYAYRKCRDAAHAFRRMLRRHDRRLWQWRRSRELHRWAKGKHSNSTFKPCTCIDMTVGPAGAHTCAEVDRQRELVKHNQRGRVSVLRLIRD